MSAGPSPIDPRSIFREKALQKHLEEENADDLLIISPSYWRYALIYLAIMASILLVWLFFGALPIEIKGKGIFMSEGGLFGIEAQSSGFVKEVLVEPGSLIKAGEPLAILQDPQQEIALEFAEGQLEHLEKDYQNRKKQFEFEDQKNRESLHKQIQANEQKIARLEKQIPNLEKDYQKKRGLAKEQLISTTTLLEAEKLLLQRRTALETTKSTIASLQARLKKSYREEELKEMEQRLIEQKEIRDLLQMTKDYNLIFSSVNARVLENLVRPGDVVTPGKRIFWIEASEKGIKDIVVYAFVYMEIGKRIAIGQQILIQPANINSQEFGSLIGHIVDISPSTVSNEEIETYIHSRGLEAYLIGGAPSPYLVTIKPELDPSTPSGFKWTSGKGSPFVISTGSVCSVSGIAYYERPIVKLLPFWRLELFFNETKQWFYSWFE